MKILILANDTTGLYKFRKELLQKLCSLNNKVYISLPQGDFINELKSLGCKFINTNIDRRGINPLKDVKLVINYYWIISRLNPDLVITYTIKPNIYGGFMCELLNFPYAVNITGLGTAIENGGILQEIVCHMYRVALKKAKIVFFENYTNRDKMIKFRTVKKEKTKVLPGAGVNMEEYYEMPYPMGEVIKFLFVGRLMKEKGIEELLFAAKRLKKMYRDKVIIDLVGSYEESYKKTVEKLVQKGIVNYYGCQQDVRKFYRICSAVVLPSYHEGMSNVLLEAAASGRVIIASNIPGCREAVIDGETGFLCKVKDADDLYQKMQMFIELTIEQRKEMGSKAMKHIEEKFQRMMVVEKTISELVEKTCLYI